MKEDERRLLEEMQRRARSGQPCSAREVVRELGINEKRAAYILWKWTDRGWYNYGVNVMSGWLEREGMNAQP